ncbi:MAG: hypothetical protein ACI4EK_00135 [Wujia sp.]
MNEKNRRTSGASITISAVALVASLLIDLYLILVYPSMIQVIIAVSLIAVVDTYFLIDGILTKIDDIASLNLDKQNELTKVEKGIYSVAKREEISRNQSMSAMLDLLLEMKEENAKLLTDVKDDNSKLLNEMIQQDKLMTKVHVKKDQDHTEQIISSNEKLAVALAKMATANAKSSDETIEILNDICKELEQRNQKLDDKNEYSHLRVMDKAE